MADSKVRANMLNLSGDYPFTGSVTGHVGDGSITEAKLSGTISASKLTGAMPALDGSTLTGIPGITKSASDPVVTTNPSGGVGSLWANSTSGEMFVCTDATAGANIWTNVGGGTGDIPIVYSFQGTVAGYTSGGQVGGPTPLNHIHHFLFSTSTGATDVGNLSVARRNPEGCLSDTHGYTCGGDSDVIDKFSFANAAAGASDVGNLTRSLHNPNPASSATHGYCAGGSTGTQVIDKISFTTDGNATTNANLSTVNDGGQGHSSPTHGFASLRSSIEKYSFAADTDGTDVGSLQTARQGAGGTGHSSTEYGFVSGGEPFTQYGSLKDRFPFASGGTAVDWGDLSVPRSHPAGSSSLTHAYTSGGQGSGGNASYINVMDKFPYASNVTSTDIGDLAVQLGYTCGTHD